jgi:ATP-binding cassette subfamily C (CFTR/MRP) protein 1
MVQKRIAITASTLSEMRSVKMMGLTRLLSRTMHNRRVEETEHMAAFRWSIVWQNLVQNLPWALAPALTFVIYAAQALAQGKSSLGTTQAFTSLSIITLLTNPAAKLLSAIPSTTASLGCFDRIQAFLISPALGDQRITWPSRNLTPSADRSKSSSAQDLAHPAPYRSAANVATISMDRVALRPAPSAQLVLQDITLTIQRGSLTLIIGPIGSGKTTLLKAILGELPCEDSGVVAISSRRTAYSAQTPWLPNTTIRQAITGPPGEEREPEKGWYQECVYACVLDHDLDSLPEGDETRIGTGSTTLSGGQKHRISLARAVYSRADTIILDDVISALDVSTQATLMSRLFGVAGLLRKLNATVILATHASSFPPPACILYWQRLTKFSS